jgi:hypothetical protein
MMMSIAFVIIFCHNLVKTIEDENERNTCNQLLCKGTKVKKKQKKKVDVHLLATNALVIFWRSIFCNTTLAMSFVTLLQHCFCTIVFCNIDSTLPLQHCIQQHSNITFIT